MCPLKLSRRWYSFSASRTHLSIPTLGSFSYIWLRDACQAPQSLHPSTRQKLLRSSDIDLAVHPADDGVYLDDHALRVKWNDGYESHFPMSFLKHHSALAQTSVKYSASVRPDVQAITWDRDGITQSPSLFLDYEVIKKPSGLLSAIDQLCQYGLLFIRGVPNNDPRDETCELVQLSRRFSEIRETFYGKVWDVKNRHNSKNIAYTNLYLGFHMDLLYFQNPPQFQVLHCLRNRVNGGHSLFVDAFHAANKLQVTHPFAFEILSSTAIPFHYVNDGHHLYYEHPTIELNETHADVPIKHVNYSPPFQAPFSLTIKPEVFESLSRLSKIIDDPRHIYEYLLREGDAVLFDNRRVLHARTAFSERSDGESKGYRGAMNKCAYEEDVLFGDAENDSPFHETNRWLKGCYLDEDILWDRARILRKAMS